jgi:hypothetical protein
LYAAITTALAWIGTHTEGDVDRPRRGGWAAAFGLVFAAQAIAIGIFMVLAVIVILIMGPGA